MLVLRHADESSGSGQGWYRRFCFGRFRDSFCDFELQYHFIIVLTNVINSVDFQGIPSYSIMVRRRCVLWSNWDWARPNCNDASFHEEYSLDNRVEEFCLDQKWYAEIVHNTKIDTGTYM